MAASAECARSSPSRRRNEPSSTRGIAEEPEVASRVRGAIAYRDAVLVAFDEIARCESLPDVCREDSSPYPT